jgi:hypothetical protein
MVVVASLGLLAAERTARACKCFEAALERTLVPPSGTTGFPTNGRIRILLTAFPAELRPQLLPEYRLKDDQGKLVPFDGQVDGTMLTLVPRTPLRPSTRYTLERAHAFAANGRRLNDTERWRAMDEYGLEEGQDKPALRRWYADGWLTTGAGIEDRRPPAPPPVRVKIEFRHGGGDCGPGTGIEATFDFQNTAFAPGDVVALERKGHGMLGHWVPHESRESPGRGLVYASNLACTSDAADIDPSGNFELRLVTLSATGAAVPSASWTVVNPSGTRPKRASRLDLPQMQALRRAAVARWSTPPLSEETSVESIPGPMTCPFGLESRGRHELGGPVPGKSGDELSLGWAAGEVRIVGNDRDTRSGWIVRWSKDAFKPRLGLPKPVDTAQALFRPEETLVTIVAYGRDHESQLKTIMMSSEGKVRWTRRLGERGTNTHPFMAWGQRNILLCWSHSTPRTLLAPRLLCAILNSANGSLVRRPSPLKVAPGEAAEVQPGEGYGAAVATQQGFAIAWTLNEYIHAEQEERVAHLTLLTESGVPIATRKLGGEGVNALSIDRVGSELAVAWDGTRGIEVTWLGIDGQDHRAPYSLDTGTGAHGPRMAQHRGLLAVGWGEDPGGHGFIAVTDPSGKVSPRLQVASGPTLVATDDGFAAAYDVSNGSSSYVETLVCRSRAADGPPDRIVVPIQER